MGTCDHAAAVFAELIPLIGDDLNEDIWERTLKEENMRSKAEDLFKFWASVERKKSMLSQTDCIRYIQIFLLLENVFRNALLRPYVRAYRVVNKRSGRFQCFVRDTEKRLFEKLHFHERDPDLFVYENTDIVQTIVFAITCNIFWHALKMKLPTFPQ